MTALSKVWMIACGVVVMFGCDDSSGNGEAGAGAGNTSTGNGVTSCGDDVCQAGQYCADADFSDCVLGCLSNANCADDQMCEKEPDDFGGDVGTCVNDPNTGTGGSTGTAGGGGTGVTPECQAFCDKLGECSGTPLTPAECQAVCSSAPEACQICLAGASCADPDPCQAECNS